MSPGRKTGLPWCGRPAPAREIDERLTRDRRSSVVPLAVEPVDNRVGAGSHQVTQGVSRCPISGILPARSRIQCGYRETYQLRCLTVHEVSGKLPILRERQQAARAAESKCLQRTPKGVRAARKGTGRTLPGAESQSSAVRVSDGVLESIPEDSLDYCLLLGGGDTNDRGEDGEGFNTPVCRPRGVQKTSKRGPSSGQDRACAKTDSFQNVAKPGDRTWSGARGSQVQILPF